jgi:hypothetical protein
MGQETPPVPQTPNKSVYDEVLDKLKNPLPPKPKPQEPN